MCASAASAGSAARRSLPPDHAQNSASLIFRTPRRWDASEVNVWPATEPLVFAGLLVPAVFIPVLVVAGMSNLRPRGLGTRAQGGTR